MNILPKKRWHVRTRENIARVRRDEAAAAENEKARKARVQKAETEARINLLRDKTRSRYDGRGETTKEDAEKIEKQNLQHVNFFEDLEEGKIDHHKPNAEHEAEKKAEKEKYEQQIGYLTYLGQNINAPTGSTSWYDELPRRLIDKESKKEIQENKKVTLDPMTDIKRYISIMNSSRSKVQTDVRISEHSKKQKLVDDNSNDESRKRHKHKKDREKLKKHNSNKHKRSKLRDTNASSIDIEKLRKERLLREQAEKLKTDALLAKFRGDSLPPLKKEEVEPKIVIRQKYNSQFCPEIARQNMEITSGRR